MAKFEVRAVWMGRAALQSIVAGCMALAVACAGDDGSEAASEAELAARALCEPLAPDAVSACAAQLVEHCEATDLTMCATDAAGEATDLACDAVVECMSDPPPPANATQPACVPAGRRCTHDEDCCHNSCSTRFRGAMLCAFTYQTEA